MFNTTRKVVTFNWQICVFFCEFVFSVCKRKLLEEVEGVRCSVVGSYHYTSSYGYFISLGTQFCNKQAIYFPSYLCQQKGWPAATKNKEEAEKEKRRKSFSSEVKYKNIIEHTNVQKLRPFFLNLSSIFHLIRTSHSHPTCSLLVMQLLLVWPAFVRKV